jgi:hypothetical protein
MGAEVVVALAGYPLLAGALQANWSLAISSSAGVVVVLLCSGQSANYRTAVLNPIAAAHHEKADGPGYHKRLRAEPTAPARASSPPWISTWCSRRASKAMIL